MPSPFPGMDPFLEDPAIFPDLHDSLIFCIREALNVVLPQPYYAGIASRVWIEESHRRVEPDVNVLRPIPQVNGGVHPGGRAGGGGVAVAQETATEPVEIEIAYEEVRQTFLEIHAQPGGEHLVTTIEVLSPSNKTPGGHGRTLYLQKQDEVLQSQVHLVEIDLLRIGLPTTLAPPDRTVRTVGHYDYHVCVHRWDRPRVCSVYPVQLTGPLPVVAVPLLPDAPPASVNLKAVLDRAYDSARYRQRARYRDAVPPPPLHPNQEIWVEEILRAAGLRQPPPPEATA